MNTPEMRVCQCGEPVTWQCCMMCCTKKCIMQVGQTNHEKRELKAEKRSARFAIMPVLQAEEDRRCVLQLACSFNQLACNMRHHNLQHVVGISQLFMQSINARLTCTVVVPTASQTLSSALFDSEVFSARSTAACTLWPAHCMQG